MAVAERRAAVVGASGFLGGALVRALTERGIEATGFTRSTPFFSSAGTLHPGVATADTVFWLASTIRPATAEAGGTDPSADRRALATLLEALPPNGPRRVVAASSGGTVYDSGRPSPHTESSPVAPANAYGRAMLSIESLLSERVAEPVMLRVSNAYGPRQRPKAGQGVIAHWFTAIASGQPVQLLGSDQVARDYVYIDDVVDALLRVNDADPAPPSIINIGSGRPTTLRELLELVRATVAPCPVDERYEPGRRFDAPSTWLDPSLASSALGWRPHVDLPEGLRRMWLAMTASPQGPDQAGPDHTRV